MLKAVYPGAFDLLCHNCGVLSLRLTLPNIQVTDLRDSDSAVSHQLHVECPNCTAGEAWPVDHSPLIQDLQRQLGLL